MASAQAAAEEKAKPAASTPESSGGSEDKAEPASSTPKSSGGYKIGVFDRKKVLDGYNKVKNEYEELQKEVERRQVEIDALSDKIQAAKDKYQEEKEALSAGEQAEREAGIQAEYRQYQATLQTDQAGIDDKERLLMKRVFSEINEAVAKVGSQGDYHLILEGNSRSGVVYYSTTLDVTGQIVDELNKNP